MSSNSSNSSGPLIAVLFTMFLGFLKLCGVNIPWMWVFFPIWFPTAVVCCLVCCLFILVVFSLIFTAFSYLISGYKD